MKDLQDRAPDFAAASREFEFAWQEPNHTRVELPPIDVNAVLTTHYDMAPGFHMTKQMMWDMELKKAYDPGLHLSFRLYSHPAFKRVVTVEGNMRLVFIAGRTPTDEQYT